MAGLTPVRREAAYKALISLGPPLAMGQWRQIYPSFEHWDQRFTNMMAYRPMQQISFAAMYRRNHDLYTKLTKSIHGIPEKDLLDYDRYFRARYLSNIRIDQALASFFRLVLEFKFVHFLLTDTRPDVLAPMAKALVASQTNIRELEHLLYETRTDHWYRISSPISPKTFGVMELIQTEIEDLANIKHENAARQKDAVNAELIQYRLAGGEFLRHTRQQISDEIRRRRTDDEVLDQEWAGFMIQLRLFQVLEQHPEGWYLFGFSRSIPGILNGCRRIYAKVASLDLDKLASEGLRSSAEFLYLWGSHPHGNRSWMSSLMADLRALDVHRAFVVDHRPHLIRAEDIGAGRDILRYRLNLRWDSIREVTGEFQKDVLWEEKRKAKELRQQAIAISRENDKKLQAQFGLRLDVLGVQSGKRSNRQIRRPKSSSSASSSEELRGVMLSQLSSRISSSPGSPRV